MVGFKLLSTSLLVAVSIAAPLAQISAPVNNAYGSPVGGISLSSPNGPPQQGPFSQPGGFPSGPEFEGPQQGGFQGQPGPDAGEDGPQGEAGCATSVWYQPWTWLSSCTTTTGTGEVDSTIDIE